MKTLDVQAKEWFDKVNGNSYFSARVTIDYSLDSEQVYYLPFQYGYGSMYEQETRELLRKEGIIPKDAYIGSFCRENNIPMRSSKQGNCLKREVKSWGTK